MPSLSSDPRLARDSRSTLPSDSTIEDISQAVDSAVEKFTAQAVHQSRSQTLENIHKKRNRSISPDNICSSKRQKKHQNGSPKRPAFEELPYGSKEDPKASAWGLWGPKDELGTLNYLTPDVISHASKEIRTGFVIPLNLPLDCPLLPMNPQRAPCEHHILAKGYANDDKISLNTQGSSHWDGLRHYPYQSEDHPKYYNGVSQADISGPTANHRIGIQSLFDPGEIDEYADRSFTDAAQRGIVGRGVLLDWRAYALRNNIKYSAFKSHPIPLSELLAVAAEQNITFQLGDILLIRSGWTEEYLKLSDDEQLKLGKRGKREFVGVEASREMIKWHWDIGFSAVAGDTTAYEVWPPTKPWGVACHEVF